MRDVGVCPHCTVRGTDCPIGTTARFSINSHDRFPSESAASVRGQGLGGPNNIVVSYAQAEGPIGLNGRGPQGLVST